MVIYAYQHHVRLLPPSPWSLCNQSLLESRESALLCNQVPTTSQKRPAMTSGLPLISELPSGCFEVKSAPQFSRSGYHDLDAQKIQALAVKKPCQRSASLLLCDRKP